MADKPATWLTRPTASKYWGTDAAGVEGWHTLVGGPGGTVWYDGSGAPAAGLGNVGDYYLDDSNGDVYNKGGGGWVVVANLTGPTGPAGPAGPAGLDDDWMFNLSTGSLRNDYTGTLGCTLTISSVCDVVVSHLGRFIIGGSTQNHKVSVWDAGTTLLDSVTFNATGIGSGFHYVALGSPLTLTAGNLYYLGSLEANLGDQWLNADGAFYSTRWPAFLGAPAYEAGDACPINVGGAGCYIPVSFRYSSP